MGVPKIIFGRCQLCGGTGGDTPSGSSHRSSADASPTDTTGNGERLYSYRGKKICVTCLNDEKAREASLRIKDKVNQSEEYRSRAGFSSTIN